MSFRLHHVRRISVEVSISALMASTEILFGPKT